MVPLKGYITEKKKRSTRWDLNPLPLDKEPCVLPLCTNYRSIELKSQHQLWNGGETSIIESQLIVGTLNHLERKKIRIKFIRPHIYFDAFTFFTFLCPTHTLSTRTCTHTHTRAHLHTHPHTHCTHALAHTHTHLRTPWIYPPKEHSNSVARHLKITIMWNVIISELLLKKNIE